MSRRYIYNITLDSTFLEHTCLVHTIQLRSSKLDYHVNFEAGWRDRICVVAQEFSKALSRNEPVHDMPTGLSTLGVDGVVSSHHVYHRFTEYSF